MPSRGTPVRTLRVPDDVWTAAEARAADESSNLRAEILRFIREYATTKITTRDRNAR